MTVTAGQPASFTVTASGTAPLSYQWDLAGKAISGATSASYSIAAAASSNAGVYAVMVSNSVGSATSSNSTLTVNPVSGSAIKWHPGMYVYLDPNEGPQLDSQGVQSNDFDVIDAIGTDPTIKGYAIHLHWSQLEGATLGSFDSSVIDSYLNKVKQYGKHLTVQVEDRGFGCCIAPAKQKLPSFAFPSYMFTPTYFWKQYTSGANKGGYTWYPVPDTSTSPPTNPTIGLIAPVWFDSVMGRLEALSQFLAGQYDSDPAFEWLTMEETIIDNRVGNGYTNAAYQSEVEDWLAKSTTYWQHTQVRLNANFSDNMDALMSYAQGLGGVIIGGPDTVPNSQSTAQLDFNTVTGGYVNVPWVGEYQETYGNSGWQGYTPDDMYKFNYNTMHMSYMLWPQGIVPGPNAAPPTVDQLFVLPKNGVAPTKGQLAYIHSVNGAVYSSACPQSYVARGGCNTQ